MSMKNTFVLFACLTLTFVQGRSDSDIIEPKLRMIDRSSPTHHRPMGNNLPQHHNVPNLKLTGDVNLDFAETISFGVNTRGELGPTRAPLFCSCNVLAGLFEDDEQTKPQKHSISSRSYTAPELREHVPLLSVVDAQKTDQISFGVNIRGEEGPEFHPTWCNCQVVKTAMPRGGASPHQSSGGDNEEEEDEEEEENFNPHRQQSTGAVRGPRAFSRNPHNQIENIQTAEGVNQPKEIKEKENSEKETVMNLQMGEGKSKSKKNDSHKKEKKENNSSENKVENKVRGRQRRSYSVGVNVDKNNHIVNNENNNNNNNNNNDQEIVSSTQPASVDYVFRGHHFNANGKQVFDPRKEILKQQQHKQQQQQPQSETADTQILTQLDEGSNMERKYVNETIIITPKNKTSQMILKSNDEEEAEKLMNQETETQNITIPTNVDVRLLQNATVVNNNTVGGVVVSENINVTKKNEDEENSEDEDAVTVLTHMARAHPHASQVLSNALKMAATQQQETLAKLQNELIIKEHKISEIETEKEKTIASYKAEVDTLTKIIQNQLKTLLSPSTTPSSSQSPSSSPIPSPSANPSATPQPVLKGKKISDIHYHHPHRPRKNRKACYHKCGDEECAAMFSQSLRQYASCMDNCASKCYDA